MMMAKKCDANVLTVDSETDFKTNDANSYNAVVDYFDKYTERFTRHMPGPMLELASVPDNARVLDVGTGTGVVALNIVEGIGAKGKVVGIDLSDGMLSTATAKAQQRRLSGHVEFLKMDAENLDFPDSHFDAAFSLYALRHFPNPEKSVAEIYRVLKPGSSIVVAVGSRPDLVSVEGMKATLRRLGSMRYRLLRKELRACEFIDSLVEKYIPEGADRDVTEWVGERHGFSGSVEQLIREAGFTDVQASWKGQYSRIESPEDFWLLQMTFSSKARKRIAQADDKLVNKLKSEFFRRCETVIRKKGRLVYQTGAAIISAKKTAH